jgi:hypothetical protein
MQGGGWGLVTVWAIGGRQSHGGGVVVAAQACSGLRLLPWFIVGNDGADVGGYLSVPLPGWWWCGFLVRCGCVVWWCGAWAHLVWLQILSWQCSYPLFQKKQVLLLGLQMFRTDTCICIDVEVLRTVFNGNIFWPWRRPNRSAPSSRGTLETTGFSSPGYGRRISLTLPSAYRTKISAIVSRADVSSGFHRARISLHRDLNLDEVFALRRNISSKSTMTMAKVSSPPPP